MSKRFDHHIGAMGNEWVCWDIAHGKPVKTQYWGTIISVPYRAVTRCRDNSLALQEGQRERDGFCDHDPCFPDSVRPYSPVRRKDIPKDVLARLEFPKETNARERKAV